VARDGGRPIQRPYIWRANLAIGWGAARSLLHPYSVRRGRSEPP